MLQVVGLLLHWIQAAFTGSCIENPIWNQQCEVKQFRTLRGGQLIVDFDAAENCRSYVTTMEAMISQDDNPWISMDNFKDQYVLVIDLISMQDAAEKCDNPELVGDFWRLELIFTFPLEHLTEFIVLAKRIFSVAVDKLGGVGKNF